MAELREPTLADLTLVRLHSGVDARVLRQIGRVGETLVAR